MTFPRIPRPIRFPARLALVSHCLLAGLLALPLAALQVQSAKQVGRAGDELVKPGIVVETVEQGRGGDNAGLKVGDVLLSWSRGSVSGRIESPFDLGEIETEQKPRGGVKIEGLRGTEKQAWALGPDVWGIQSRPVFSKDWEAIYREGRELASGGNWVQAKERWNVLVAQPQSAGPFWLRPWLNVRMAGLQEESRLVTEADASYQEAVQSAVVAPLYIKAQLLRAWGHTFEQRSVWADAEKYYQQALAVENPGPENLARAVDLDNLGNVAYARGDVTKADDYFRQALQIREEQAPGSLDVAVSLNNLGRMADQRGDLARAEEHDRHALSIAEKLAPNGQEVAASLRSLGDVAYHRGDLAKANEYYSQALKLRERLSPGDLARCLNGLGNVVWSRGDLAKAEEYHRQALAIREKLVPGSLDVAASLNSLGNVALGRGDLANADEYYHQALAIREKIGPGSLVVATSLSNLGLVASARGDLAEAEEYNRRALAIREKLAPASMDVAASLNSLGTVWWERGDLAKAEECHRQALAIMERLAPGSLGLAASLNNLGIVAYDRGDLEKAEEYYRQARAIKEKLAPGSLTVASSLMNLGNVAWARGDLAKAQEYYRQALVIQEKLAPGSMDPAESLNNLGAVMRDRGDPAKAEEYYRQALVIMEKLAPRSLYVAEGLTNLGQLMQDRGDPAKAEDYYLRAADIKEKLAPGSLDLAWTLHGLGDVVRDRGDLAAAEEYYRRALAIRERVAPGSAVQADTLAALAGIMIRRQQQEAAAQLYEQALNALESQTARLGGGDEVRASFRAKHGAYYKDYLDLLIRQNQAELAFQTLERSRARMLLETLAAAHADVRKGADPALLERERTLQSNIKAKSDRRIRLLSDKSTDEQVKAVEKEISNLTAEYQDVEGQIRAGSPGYAALTQPQPLSAKQIQRLLLDQDTVLLEYSLGEERSYVFAMTTESLQAFQLPKRSEVEKASRNVYELLTARNRKLTGETPAQKELRLRKADAGYTSAAALLSHMVLAPVAAQIPGKRLLIVADGALQYIPFAVLPEPTVGSASEPAQSAPLVMAHEIINLPSASVLAVLRQQEKNRPSAPKGVAVLADPVFLKDDPRVLRARRTSNVAVIASAGANPRSGLNQSSDRGKATDDLFLDSVSAGLLTRSAADVGLSRNGQLQLPRLLFSRMEADAIMAVVPPGAGLEAVDFRASRATAISPELGQYHIVHLATHGLLNSEHPELSGLVLSLVDPEGKPQEGFLDLQDIYNLNLSADLVVLSACETGLGKEISGEGLVGMTRGFMYAGASRVVASLWNVSDDATAKLMTEFYLAMEKNHSAPAAALRQAQVHLRKQVRWSSPYFWAAFQIQGDWKQPTSSETRRQKR